ncbi:ROK family protein [Nocardioides pantholopis]|uniref:ROK family protein n=1 Tax=Nocardioides pantholopis TaxID=2483798 RepID=UPI001F1520C9|nr:ROK family transcriptional regulator [Nocardioides pantholopis]
MAPGTPPGPLSGMPRVAAPRPARAGPLDRVRAANRRAVLALLVGGPQSRADICRGTGLSRSTVSGLVAELLASGHLAESAARGTPHKGGSGRPPVLVALATPPGLVAGVDVGHHHVRAVLADRSGRVLAQQHAEVDVDASGRGSLDVAADLVRRTLAGSDRTAGPEHRLLVAGMCVPAPVDRRSGTVRGGILPGWRGLAPAQELTRRLGVPTVADNDANLGALAELHRGAARGLTDVVYIKLAGGLGSGIVLGGRLHRGATGSAGEIGHVQVAEDGEVCRCGNRGCLETRVAAPRLLRLLRPAYDEELDVAGVLRLDREGDSGVRRVLGDAGRTIGRALADLCNSLNPQAVVVGGSLGSSPALVAGVREAVTRYAQPDTATAVQVLPGQLGDQAEALGAVALGTARLAAT